MEELKEIAEQDRFIILHEGKVKNGNLMNVLVPFAQSDLKNANGRIYPYLYSSVKLVILRQSCYAIN